MRKAILISGKVPCCAGRPSPGKEARPQNLGFPPRRNLVGEHPQGTPAGEHLGVEGHFAVQGHLGDHARVSGRQSLSPRGGCGGRDARARDDLEEELGVGASKKGN